MWQVLSADAFSAFEDVGLQDDAAVQVNISDVSLGLMISNAHPSSGMLIHIVCYSCLPQPSIYSHVGVCNIANL